MHTLTKVAKNSVSFFFPPASPITSDAAPRILSMSLCATMSPLNFLRNLKRSDKLRITF